MAGASLKKDFKDGDKLFAQQLNNNFGAIEAALAAMNKIVWQDDPDDMVVTFRGTTEEINSRDIIDGQLLYDTTTGETYIDYGSQRISTGSGNAIFIGDTEPSNPSTQLWINPDEPMQSLGSEVVDSLIGDETNKAPSVRSINRILDHIESKFDYDTTEHIVGTWIDGKPIYRKVINCGALPNTNQKNVAHNISNLGIVVSLKGMTTGDNKFTLPEVRVDSGDLLKYQVGLWCTNTNIVLETANDRSNTSAFVIIEYTKTDEEDE